MLAHLSVRNFALIEHAELDFKTGFTVITGETGSGKSILLGALNLILGERADYSVIRNSDQKTIVEAVFQLKPKFKTWFNENEMDWDPETTIRREITAQGKSRAFINDSPVQLNQLKELSEQLIYIHSQHETLEIKKSQFQFSLIDSFGNTLDLFEKYKILYSNWKKAKSAYESFFNKQALLAQEEDYIRFQLTELQQIDLKNHSFQQYEIELKRMEQLDDLRLSFSVVSNGLEGDNGVADQLRVLKSRIEKSQSLDPKLEEFTTRIQTALLELEDIAEDASQQLETLEMDPKRQEVLVGYLDRFHSLLRKHNLSNQEELLLLENQFQQKLDTVEQADDELLELQNKVSQIALELENLGSELYQKRLATAISLEKHLQSLLENLKLPDARLQFQIARNEAPDGLGGMSVQFLFSANAGMDLKPIERAASGGELSRLMLAIQATLSAKSDLPTLILDEIDTGVSGEVALRIGKMLHQMGTHLQLFGITHLPQVAAKGQHHFEVSKFSIENQTNTSIQILSYEQRVDAIAKLMSGEQITAASKENAMSLMQ